MATTLRDIGEFSLIDKLKARLPAPSPRVLVPIGDDAAVSQLTDAGEVVVSTVDLLVERVDFERSFPPRLVGRKAVAVNLSDLAAMAASPRGILVAVAAPSSVPLDWMESLYDGIGDRARSHQVDVLGGDLSGTSDGSPLVVSITALGAARPDRLVRRTGARVGDLVCVTGWLGEAAAGLQLLRGSPLPGAGEKLDLRDPLVARQLDPEPRVPAGIALGGLAHSMIDVSDGLLADLGHLCQAAGLGARIEVEKLPLSPALRATGLDAGGLAMTGGEDFELLFALQGQDERRAREACGEAGMTVIGTFTAGDGISLAYPDGRVCPPPAHRGWTHFR